MKGTRLRWVGKQGMGDFSKNHNTNKIWHYGMVISEISYLSCTAFPPGELPNPFTVEEMTRRAADDLFFGESGLLDL